MNPDNNRNEPPPDSSNGDIAQANNISEYMINARDANSLVYCRFGERYLADIERR